MRVAPGPRGLRARIVVAFAAGALLVAAVLVVTTFLLARGYLLEQREEAATRAAFVHADLLRSRLATAGTEVGDALSGLPSARADVVIRSGAAWYSSGLVVGARDVPASLRDVVESGSAARLRVASSDGPRLVIGVPVTAAGLEFYEVVPLVELQSVLRTLAAVLAARREELSSRSRQALDLVEQQLARFRVTLDDLLELARIDNDPAGDEQSPVAMDALVREVLAVSGRPAALLRTDGTQRTVVHGDKLRLERAVRNLLDNADRHAGGVCCVRVQRRDGSVVVTVDDAGPGVPHEDRERVFERFVRGPRAARGSQPGAGLGLAIVAETAARHGGAAWCSASPCGGARMSLSLPAEQA